MKQNTQINEMRITQSIKQSLHLKRQKSLEVKLQEENCRLTRTIFLEKKRLLAQSRSQIELQPLEQNTMQTKEQIRLMK